MTYHDDAREFGEHIRHGGEWRYGLIVARCVGVSSETGKVSARKFADAAEVSHATVSRYLKAWNHAADWGLVPSSSNLRAGQDYDTSGLDVGAWSEFYRLANKSSRGPSSGSVAGERDSATTLAEQVAHWRSRHEELAGAYEALRADYDALLAGSGGDWAVTLLAAAGSNEERVFRALAKVLHPDVAGDTVLMQQLNEARDLLMGRAA